MEIAVTFIQNLFKLVDWTGNRPIDLRVSLNTFLSLDLKLTLSMKAKNVPRTLKLELVNSWVFFKQNKEEILAPLLIKIKLQGV